MESLLDEVMDHLLVCDVIDPSVSESYGPADEVRIEFRMQVATDEPDEAVVTAMASLRAGLHARGAQTPGWEQIISRMRKDIRATSTDDDLVEA